MADLQTINSLEGDLSQSQILSIRRRVIAAGGDLQDYQDTLAYEVQQSNEAIAQMEEEFGGRLFSFNDDDLIDEDDDGSTEYAFNHLYDAVSED